MFRPVRLFAPTNPAKAPKKFSRRWGSVHHLLVIFYIVSFLIDPSCVDPYLLNPVGFAFRIAGTKVEMQNPPGSRICDLRCLRHAGSRHAPPTSAYAPPALYPRNESVQGAIFLIVDSSFHKLQRPLTRPSRAWKAESAFLPASRHLYGLGGAGSCLWAMLACTAG